MFPPIFITFISSVFLFLFLFLFLCLFLFLFPFLFNYFLFHLCQLYRNASQPSTCSDQERPGATREVFSPQVGVPTRSDQKLPDNFFMKFSQAICYSLFWFRVLFFCLVLGNVCCFCSSSFSRFLTGSFKQGM
jgi:hypothetical protein